MKISTSEFKRVLLGHVKQYTPRIVLLYYNYYIIDSLQVDARKTLVVRYHPKPLVSTPTFDGEMHIDAEDFALRSIHASMRNTVNVNWLRDFVVDASYQRLSDSTWFYKSDRLYVDLSLSLRDSSKMLSFIGKKDMCMERFRQELNDVGIAVVDNEEAIANNKTKNRPLIHLCSRFHSLDQVLMRMLKESDNLYAESVLYQIAAAGGIKNATATHARQWIHKLITRIGLNPGDYKFADGSGLSLYNYVSAELMVSLLRYAYHNQNIFGHLYPALPIAGVDGTLEKRMKGAFTNGNVRAKTGTLTGISSLAGYCTAANGHQLAFAIINQGVLRNTSGRTFQDKVCTALCEP